MNSVNLGNAAAPLVLIGLTLAGCGPAATPPRPAAPRPPAVPSSMPVAPASQPASPPAARRQQLVDTIHGQRVADPYRWLEQAASAETRAWVKAHAAHARRRLSALPRRAALARRLKELHYVDWSGAPQRRGARYFFTRRHATKEKAVYYWRQGERGEARVLLDPNLLSKRENVSVRGVYVSYDGKKAAYKLSRNNADKASLYVKMVATGQVSTVDVIPGAKYARPSWTPASDGFYYTRLPSDEAIKAAKIKVADIPGHAAVYFHRLGQEPAKDKLVHPHTGDPKAFISASLGRAGRYLLINISHGWASTDVYFRDLREGKRAGFRPLVVGQPNIYWVYPHKGRFYVLTNDGAPRYRIFKVNPRRPARASWRVVVAQHPEDVLDDFAVRGGQLALRYMHRATVRLELVTLAGKRRRVIPMPALGTASGLVGNPEDDAAYWSYSSYLSPTKVYRTSIKRGSSEVYSRVKLRVDASPFVVEQVRYASPRDRTQVSMFVLRRKDLPRDGSTPFLLAGYGGFNISVTPTFRPKYLVWLEQGGGVALPNLRGGGEYGEQWHKAGMLGNKQNVFDDFIGAAQYLIKQGYTSSSKLAVAGGSNGGLLVGAAMVQRPDLFAAVVCRVPLLDMVRYHLFGSGKTWMSEYGNPAKPHDFKFLHAYSPYHQLRQKVAYPALLMMSADSDDRVDPFHARKFTAAVLSATTSNRPVLFRMETDAGHGGGDMIKKRVAATTDAYSFLLSQLAPAP